MDINYSAEDLCNITIDLIKVSEYKEDIYIRPLAYKSEEKVANLKLHELESNWFNDSSLEIILIMINPLDAKLFMEEASWLNDANRVKLIGLYTTSILAKTEAIMAGFDEAILNFDGVYLKEVVKIYLYREMVIYYTFWNWKLSFRNNKRLCFWNSLNEFGIEIIREKFTEEIYLADEV